MFLQKMIEIGFLNYCNAPTEGAQKALPTDNDPPMLEQQSKTVVFFHDETTFSANEDQNIMWGIKGHKMIKPKSKGSGIMLSDFIDEINGFLALNDEEYKVAKESNPQVRQYAREILEYGERRDRYWTRDTFMAQIEKAVEIAEFKYPKSSGWQHMWVFDHSSCHAAMADDALDVSHMNVKPGGKQRIMRDTECDGMAQKMYATSGGEKVAKGMKTGISTVGKMLTGCTKNFPATQTSRMRRAW